MDGLLAIARYWFNRVKIVIATESTEEHENIFLSGHLFFRVLPCSSVDSVAIKELAPDFKKTSNPAA